MTDLNVTIDHDILLAVAKTLIPGFKDSLGLCEGISTTLLQAVTTGPIQEKEFYDHIKFLSDYLSTPGNTAETLKNDIENVYKSKIIPESNPPLTEIQKKQAREAREKTISPEQKEQEEKLEELLAFFSTVTLEHNADGTFKLFKTANQLNKAIIHQTVASSALEKQGKFVHTNFIGLICGNKKDLSEYFLKIGMQLNSNQNVSDEKMSFLLSGPGHTVSLYFDKNEGGKWRFFDVGNIEKKYYYHEVSVNEPDVLVDILFHEPDDIIYDDDPGLTDDDDDDLSFIIRQVTTNGFDFTIGDFEREKKLDKNFPPRGKIFLTEAGKYIFRDRSNILQEGNIISMEVNTSDLKSKILDFNFRKSILELISKISAVNVRDNPVLNSINETSNQLLFTNAERSYLLNYAVEMGQTSLVEKLISVYGLNKDLYMLSIDNAVSIGNAAILKILIKSNEESPNKVDKSNYEYYDNAINQRLVKAAGLGHLECVKELLAIGADKEAITDAILETDLTMRNYSPLIAAAQYGHFEVVKYLLDLKVNKGSYYQYDSKKETALIRAVQNGHSDIVNLLMNYGSTIPQEEISRAYSLAKAANQSEIMKILTEPPNPKAVSFRMPSRSSNNKDSSAPDQGQQVNPKIPKPPI